MVNMVFSQSNEPADARHPLSPKLVFWQAPETICLRSEFIIIGMIEEQPISFISFHHASDCCDIHKIFIHPLLPP